MTDGHYTTRALMVQLTPGPEPGGTLAGARLCIRASLPFHKHKTLKAPGILPAETFRVCFQHPRSNAHNRAVQPLTTCAVVWGQVRPRWRTKERDLLRVLSVRAPHLII
jgi:hypothetical protein